MAPSVIWQNNKPLCGRCLVVLLEGRPRDSMYRCPKCGAAYRK